MPKGIYIHLRYDVAAVGKTRPMQWMAKEPQPWRPGDLALLCSVGRTLKSDNASAAR